LTFVLHIHYKHTYVDEHVYKISPPPTHTHTHSHIPREKESERVTERKRRETERQGDIRVSCLLPGVKWGTAPLRDPGTQEKR